MSKNAPWIQIVKRMMCTRIVTSVRKNVIQVKPNGNPSRNAPWIQIVKRMMCTRIVTSVRKNVIQVKPNNGSNLKPAC